MAFENRYILGDIFLKNYYQVYDLESETVSLGVAVNSNMKLETDIGLNSNNSLPGTVKFIIVVLVFVVVIFLGYMGFNYYKKRQQRQNQQISN